MKNLKLKFEILNRFRSQTEAAMKLGMSDSKLSSIIHGRLKANELEQEKIKDLFGQGIFEHIKLEEFK